MTDFLLIAIISFHEIAIFVSMRLLCIDESIYMIVYMCSNRNISYLRYAQINFVYTTFTFHIKIYIYFFTFFLLFCYFFFRLCDVPHGKNWQVYILEMKYIHTKEGTCTMWSSPDKSNFVLKKKKSNLGGFLIDFCFFLLPSTSFVSWLLLLYITIGTFHSHFSLSCS